MKYLISIRNFVHTSCSTLIQSPKKWPYVSSPKKLKHYLPYRGTSAARNIRACYKQGSLLISRSVWVFPWWDEKETPHPAGSRTRGEEGLVLFREE